MADFFWFSDEQWSRIEPLLPTGLRGKRKIPDVCNRFEIKSCNLYAMINALDFTTDWHP